MAGLRWTDETPSWSPDGPEIVFASNRVHPKGGIDHPYLMKADGTGVKRLTSGNLDAREPSFSSGTSSRDDRRRRCRFPPTSPTPAELRSGGGCETH